MHRVFLPFVFAVACTVIVGCRRQAENAPPVLFAEDVAGDASFELHDPPQSAPKIRFEAPSVQPRGIRFDDEFPAAAAAEPPYYRHSVDTGGVSEAAVQRAMDRLRLEQAGQVRADAVPPPDAPRPQAGAKPVVKASSGPLKVWEIGTEIPSFVNRGVTLTVVKVELYRNNRQRWHFSLMNRAGTLRYFDLSLRESYLADDKGNRYSAQGDSLGTGADDQFECTIQDGLRFPYWIDWDAPKEGVRSFTVSLHNRVGFSQGCRFNKFTVSLPEEDDEDAAEPQDEDGPILVKAKKKKDAARRAAEQFESFLVKFEEADEASLPPNWTSENGNLAVKEVGRRKGLTLLDPQRRDQVELPVPKLTGKFHLEMAFEMNEPESSIGLRLDGSGVQTPLSIEVKGDGRMLAQGKPKISTGQVAKYEGSKNTLIVERGAGGYIVKLNAAMATLPLATAAGTFESAKLSVGSSLKKTAKSPVIRSLAIAPLK